MGGDVLLLVGSSRPDGNTAHIARHLGDAIGNATTIDLAALEIDRFRYDGRHDRDAFAIVVRAMLDHRRIVFATPVYWYAMSATMKTTLDRLTDLLLVEEDRPLARALAGRECWMIATGTESVPPDGFEVPFARTAAYLGMQWCGSAYVVATGAQPSASHIRTALAPIVAALSAT